VLNRLADIAVQAGAAILPYYQAGDAQVSAKSDGSPVTLADVAAEAVIITALIVLAPDIPIVAEEATASGAVATTASRFFLVDPLDGTREFVSGSGEFTVNIALIENGRPVMGVVYAPVLGEIYAGTVGIGAQRAAVTDGIIGEWHPIRIAPAVPTALRVVASKSHLDDATREFIARFPVTEFASAGSSLKFCTLANGDADFYPRFGRTMEWDTAAGDAVLTAAGGAVLTVDGAALHYGKIAQAQDADFANPAFIAVAGFNPLGEKRS
jgi:3'(2'), 5'-bisphosphate nucleotidase